jgi:hypothetical protein
MELNHQSESALYVPRIYKQERIVSTIFEHETCVAIRNQVCKHGEQGIARPNTSQSRSANMEAGL